MKIKANKLVNFLEKLSLKGKIENCVLNFTENGITSQVRETSNVASVFGKLGKEQFDDYATIGEVGIANTPLLVKLLKRYGDSPIGLEVQENKFVIIGEKGSTYYVTCETKNAGNHMEKDVDLTEKFESSFELEVDNLVSIKEGAQTISSEEIILTVKDKKLNLTVESANGDKITEETGVESPDVMCKFGEMFMQVIDVISGKVIVYLKDEFPIVIKCGDFRYTVAPRITPEGE